MEQGKILGFELRMIHNLTKMIIGKFSPVIDKPPLTQLQAGIMSYLSHHQEQPIYQKHIEEEFNISRATATNTLQVMERNGFITRSCIDKDARLKRIIITESAMKNHMQVEKNIDIMEQRMLEGINKEEKEELFRLLSIVRNNLEKMNQEIEQLESTERKKEEKRHDKKEEKDKNKKEKIVKKEGGKEKC